jgi:hypothetical protein
MNRSNAQFLPAADGPLPFYTFTSGHLREALRLLDLHTGGRFDLWLLAGPSGSSIRQQIGALLIGRKIPKSQAGVTMLREVFNRIFQPQGDCLAVRDRHFAEMARSYLTSGTVPAHVEVAS